MGTAYSISSTGAGLQNGRRGFAVVRSGHLAVIVNRISLLDLPQMSLSHGLYFFHQRQL